MTGRPATPGAGVVISVVVPTLGRPSLDALLDALVPQLYADPQEVELLLVDDRPGAGGAAGRPGTGAGAARARRPGRRRPATSAGGPPAVPGWRSSTTTSVPAPGWLTALRRDLAVPAGVAGVQGRLRVPLPRPPPTDWERSTARLGSARWITADMAYRRPALAALSGFDERFPRAYREDAEFAFRVRAAGWRLVTGERRSSHPVRPAGGWVSLAGQRGNADDALLRRLYGRDWHELLAAPSGRRRRHAAVVGAGAIAVAGAAVAVAGRLGAERRSGRLLRRVGAATALPAAVGWLAGTAEFAARRHRRRPRRARPSDPDTGHHGADPTAGRRALAARLAGPRNAQPWPAGDGSARTTAGPAGDNGGHAQLRQAGGDGEEKIIPGVFISGSHG